jgi:thioesterase domain-containing protein/acyl carrier protein
MHEAIDLLQANLEAKSIACRPLHTSHAFHSKLMDGAVDQFYNYIRSFTLHSPSTPFISNVTGTWVKPAEVTNPHYWGQHIRNKVDFSSGINQLLNDDYQVFIEIGPGNTLTSFVKGTLNNPEAPWNTSEKKFTMVSSIRHPNSKLNDMAHLLTSFATLWQNGLDIDWQKLYYDEKRYKIPLPTYQFDEKKYWIEPVKQVYCGIGIIQETDGETQYDSTFKKSTTTDEHSDKHFSPTISNDVNHNDVTSILLQIWKEVLGVDNASVTSSFFELGGDSMLAVQMFSKVQKQTGVNLPLSTLYKAPSISALSKIISELRPKNTEPVENKIADQGTKATKILEFVVPIKTTGNKTPFFCVHGVGGNVLNHKDFIPYLSKEQPFYGIQCRGLDGIKEPFNSVQIMAQHYLDEIREVQPHGPYLLGGGSMGGLIAFEIAQQLSQIGEKIDLLLMFDSDCPYGIHHTHKHTVINLPGPQKLRYQGISKLASKITHSISCRIQDTIKYARCEFYKKQGKPIPHELRYWRIEQRNLSITDSYKPKVYNGKITLFRALRNEEVTDPYRGWKEFSQKEIDVLDFDCNHYNMLEHVEVAKSMSKVLDSFTLQK